MERKRRRLEKVPDMWRGKFNEDKDRVEAPCGCVFFRVGNSYVRVECCSKHRMRP